jgi:type 1 glutamine amidotransferase
VLIVSGTDVSAHDWRATTPVTRDLLAKAAGAEVFVCEDPAILETEALHSYDVVVLNFRNNPTEDPGERARANLAAFVASGKGLVVLHFAVYAFAGWDEYRKIVGRVWVGRAGGEKVSGHGPKGAFPVEVADSDHEITRGLADFEIDDELYAKLVGDEDIHVLLRAHSSYSEKVEPVAWTRDYGKGRVFVTVLGHDAAARKNPAFEALVRQGTIWAAAR